MPPAVTPGIQIDRYRIEAIIGAGSMGDVFRGVDMDLHRKIALKILSERHRDNKELRARFVREARAAAAISHPNVIQVFSIGTFDDRPYIAMEFLDGTDLGAAVTRSGPWSSLAAAQAVRDAARGLDAAARAGLIHRDVKPSNLVLLQDGTIKVTDFGLAKPLDTGNEPALTAMGVVVGTPDYIAPEQARGETIDHRVDIYALGGTLYYLLTAVPPFRTGKPEEDKYLRVVARHLRKPAPDACERNPAADRELAALARTMMSKKPEERPTYAGILERIDAITRRLQSKGGQARAPSMPAPTDGSGGRVAPTPFVGGRGQPVERAGGMGDHDDDAAPTRAMPERRSSETPVPAGRATPAPGQLQSSAALVTKPGLPRWLIGVTIASALLFAVGLGLTVLGSGSGPEGGKTGASEATAAPTSSARPGMSGKAQGEPEASAKATPAQGSQAELPTPPQGMLLVTRADGTPWFFVDAEPVTYGAYAAMFPNHKPAPSRGQRVLPPDRPVTGVAFSYAQAYAQSRHKRLLTAEEWKAAARTKGFTSADGQWEWIAGKTRSEDERQVIHPTRGVGTRNARDGEGITFRLAMDP